jgi:ElaB/YqjD/DUF883 family membrane-anchored ribosome-binding protein
MSKSPTSLSSVTATSVEDLAAQIDILKNDLSNLTQAISEYGIAKTDEVTHNAKVKAAQLQAAGRERATEAQDQAQEFVRTQPATAMGLAAGLGFLVGMITARR